MKELLRYCRLLLFARFYIRKGKAGAKGVVFAMTSTPDRIGKILPTIASLLDQSVQVRKIILYLPEKSRKGATYRVPEILRNHPAIELSTVATDKGPATKWYYAATDSRISGDELIIVLDDDQIYPRGLVAHYLKCQSLFPGAAFSLLGWKVPRLFLHQHREQVMAAGVKLTGTQKKVTHATEVDCFQGASSFMVKKDMLRTDEDYFSKYDAAWFADDILLSGILARKNIPVLVVPANFRYSRIHSLFLMRGDSLFANVNRDGNYNATLYKLFAPNWRSLSAEQTSDGT